MGIIEDKLGSSARQDTIKLYEEGKSYSAIAKSLTSKHNFYVTSVMVKNFLKKNQKRKVKKDLKIICSGCGRNFTTEEIKKIKRQLKRIK